MPPIYNIQEATRVAELFLNRYYNFKKLRVARKVESDWYLEYDVGLLQVLIVKITIEAATGEIISYEPQEKSNTQ